MPNDPLLEMETLNASRSRAEADPTAPRPLLTILGHPSAGRVGEVCWLDPLAVHGGSVAVHRGAPDFGEGTDRGPLRTPFASRKPLILERDRGGIRVVPGALGARIRLDGAPVAGPVQLPWARLEEGVVLRLGSHVVLLLHVELPRAETPPDLGMVGRSAAMDALRREVLRVARTDGPVLVRGATGTGKERVASALHRYGPRPGGPFLTVNLAAVPATLAASELFGHARGAFSGASHPRRGLFESAHGGTLFLDEIGDTPDEVQRALLRVLETGEVLPVGASEPRKVDVRVVAATDSDLESAIAGERFRGPLYWRLASSEIRVPLLTERRADIGRLLVHFLERELDRIGRVALLEPDPTEKHVWLSASVVERLVLHDWPGNVRELRNLARALAGLAEEPGPLAPEVVKDWLGRVEAPPVEVTAPAAAVRPRDVTDEQLEDALEACDWGLGAAARTLGISRPSLNDLVDAHPTLKRAKHLSDEEIEGARRAAEAAGEPLWRVLRVSKRGLERRLRRQDLPD